MAETTVSQAEKKKNRFRFPLWQKGVRYGEVDLAFFCQLRMGDFRGFRGQLLRKRTD